MTTAGQEQAAVVLARIETKLDHVLTAADDHERRIRALETAQSTAADHGPRIKALEANRWPLPSVAALVSVGAVIISLMR